MQPRQAFRDFDGPAEPEPARFCIVCRPALAMAFAHHEHMFERYIATGLPGAPVDQRYTRGSAPAIQGRLA